MSAPSLRHLARAAATVALSLGLAASTTVTALADPDPASPTPVVSATPKPTPTDEASATAEPTPTKQATPTAKPTATAEPTNDPTSSAPTPTSTASPSSTPSPTSEKTPPSSPKPRRGQFRAGEIGIEPHFNGPATPVVGDTVSYFVQVTNSGAETLTDVTASASGGWTVNNCGSPVLAPAGTMTCWVQYVVTEADLDAGQVGTEFTVNYTRPDGQSASTSVSLSDRIIRQSDVKLTGKASDTNGDGLIGPGDLVAWTMVTTFHDDGTTPTYQIDYGSDSWAPESCSAHGPVQAGDVVTCTSTRAIPADAGCEGRAYGASEYTVDGTSVSGGDETMVLLSCAQPSMQVYIWPNVQMVDAADQVIQWHVAVTNTSGYPFKLTFSEKLECTNFNPATDEIQPGQEVVCTRRQVVKASDLTQESISNAVTVTGTPSTGRPVTERVEGTVMVGKVAALTKEMTTQTDVNGNGLADEGDTFTYTLTATLFHTATRVSMTDPQLTPPLEACTVRTGYNSDTGEYETVETDVPLPTAVYGRAEISCVGTHVMTADEATQCRINNTAVLGYDTSSAFGPTLSKSVVVGSPNGDFLNHTEVRTDHAVTGLNCGAKPTPPPPTSTPKPSDPSSTAPTTTPSDPADDGGLSDTGSPVGVGLVALLGLIATGAGVFLLRPRRR